MPLTELSYNGRLTAISTTQPDRCSIDLWVSTYLYNALRKRHKDGYTPDQWGYSGFLGLVGSAIREWSIYTGNEVPEDWFYSHG